MSKIPRPPYRSTQLRSQDPVPVSLPLSPPILKLKTHTRLNRSYQKSSPSSLANDLQSSTNLPNPNSTKLHIQRNFTQKSSRIVHDIIVVLREENVNLKEQNMFLLEKVRGVARREGEMREKGRGWERQSEEIRRENQEIRKRIKEVEKQANGRMEEFGRKLIKIQNGEKFQQQQKEKQPEPFKGVMESRSEVIVNEGGKQELERLGGKFEGLLKECKQEKHLERKKELRRRLLEVSNRMREIRQEY